MGHKKKPKTGRATGGILTWMDPIPEALAEVPTARIVAIMYPKGPGTIRYMILTNEDLKDLVPKLAAKINKEEPAIKPDENRSYICHDKTRYNAYCFGCEQMNIYGFCQYRNMKKLKASEYMVKSNLKFKKNKPEEKNDGRKIIENPEK